MLMFGSAIYYVYRGIKYDEVKYNDGFGGIRIEHKLNFRKLPFMRTALALVFVVVGAVLLSAITIVPAGHRGVVFSQTQGVEKRILGEGFNLVMPFLESVTLMEIRIDKKEAVAQAASKDLQNVKIQLLVNYHPEAKKVNTLYQNIGEKDAFEKRIIDPSVQESVKATTPRFTAAELVQKRDLLKADAFKVLEVRLAKNNIVLDDISIVNIEFDPDYTKAIEDKVTQEQIYQKAVLVVKTKEAEARQVVATASGDKQAKILRAEGEARRNELLAESSNNLSLQQLAIQKWNGEFPQYYIMGDSNAGLLFNIPTTTTK